MLRQKRIARIVFSLCLAACMVISVSGCGLVTVSGNKHGDTRDSVVYIEKNLDEIDMELSSGTGFAIGSPGEAIRYIATNAHCVTIRNSNIDDIYDKGYYEYSVGDICDVYVYFSYADNNYLPATVYSIDREKDIAILELSEPTSERSALIFCPSDKTDIDGRFWAYGYPGTASVGDDLPRYDRDDAASRSGGIQKRTINDGCNVYLLDIDVHSGGSGSPLVNERGEAVGICTFSYDIPGLEYEVNVASYAVVIDELMQIIDREDIPYVITGDINAEGVGILTIAALVILIAIVFIAVALRKRKPASAGIAVTKTATEQPLAHPITERNAVAGKFCIKAINGYLAGRSFEIGSKVVIGRDSAKCSVVYPLETPGISAVHCEVVHDGRAVYLRDLGSSNGTFLPNGTRLAPNTPIPLNIGDRFCLASADNMFELSVTL